MRKRQRQKNWKNSGTTMLEVIIGFTVLMILDAGFLKIINVSDEMYYRAVDMLQETSDFVEELYKTEPALTTETVEASYKLVEVTEDGQTGAKLIMGDTKATAYTSSDSSVTVYRLESDN